MQSNDTVEITTPSGKKVVIRNYTTHGDDRQSEAVLNRGGSYTKNNLGETVLRYTPEAIGASTAKYVELLTVSIDGSSDNIIAMLDALKSEDYDAILKEVQRITSVPKAPSKSKL
jgi:hypothetical protein